MAMDEVLEKSICQINCDDEEEGMLPRYMYRYTLFWEHIYLSGKQLIMIGRSGMHRNKLIVQSKPMTFGDCKRIIARPGDLCCCKATHGSRFVQMKNDEDIVPLYKKNIQHNCIVIMYIFHWQ